MVLYSRPNTPPEALSLPGPEKSFGETILQKLNAAATRTRQIFDCISPEAYWMRPIGLRHPIVFYDGHLDAFAYNTVCRRSRGMGQLDTKLDLLFARGIDPKDDEAADDLSIHQWPTRAEIRDYKAKVQQCLADVIDTLAQQSPDQAARDRYALNLVLEHEMMHQETLLYILHQLPYDLKQSPLGLNTPSFALAPPLKMQIIAGGQVTLGIDLRSGEFAWDNETPFYEEPIASFQMASHPVTNGEFLEFVESNGYQRPEFWTPETFDWVTQNKLTHPFYWQRGDGGAWLYRDFFEVRALPHSWPVMLTHAEASAYAGFKKMRLPTEAEWQWAAYGDQGSQYPWGDHLSQDDEAPNLSFQHWSPTSVAAGQKLTNSNGLTHLLGNGWEWTSTSFKPFPGFEASWAYPEYSADFFDSQHYVLKGGSWFTDAHMLRPSFRNWFYWHYPYMYATCRLARDI